MPLCLFSVTFGDQPNPRILPTDARAVPAELYAQADAAAGNPGGVTRADLAAADIRVLSEFDDGQEVYVESCEAEDVLDDTDDETAAATHIWWRARVVEENADAQPPVAVDDGPPGSESPDDPGCPS